MSDTADRAGESVLGCLLAFYSPERVTVVQACGITSRDFNEIHERQEVVYRAVLALHKGGVYVDVLTVEAFLAGHGWLERAGGPGYLAVCVASAVPSALRDHARIVGEAARWRRLSRANMAEAAAIERQDDVALREAHAAVGRDVLGDKQPKLRVVRNGAA